MRPALKSVGLTMLLVGSTTIAFCSPTTLQLPVLAQSTTTQDRKAEADRLVQQGLQQYQISQFEAAFQSWQQALQIYRAIEDRFGEGRSLGNVGIAYQALGKYAQAISYYQQGLAIAREIKDRYGEGSILGNLGATYGSSGNYTQAIPYLEQHLAITREIKDRSGEGDALGNLGSAYSSLGNYAKAIEYYQQSLTITRETKNQRDEGNTLGNLGGLYFHEEDLPNPGLKRDRLLQRLMGSPDVIQIDGLGGSRPITSKVAIVSRTQRNDADVDYTFAQVEVDKDRVVYTGNCGNISSRVGPFCVDEGLVEVQEGNTRVRIYNTNTKSIILADVPVKGGKAKVDGYFAVPGVPGTGAEIVMNWVGTVGAKTGHLLPTGHPVDTIKMESGKEIEASLVDAGNPLVFVHAADFGIEGSELVDAIDQNKQLIDAVREVRGKAAVLFGLCQDWKQREYGGFLPVFGEGHKPDASQITLKLGSEWNTTAIAVKPYAAMGGLHAAIDACRALRGQKSFNADQVKLINVEVGGAVFEHGGFDIQRPIQPITAQMSLKYCVSVALLDGDALLKQFSSARINADDVWALIGKVEVCYAKGFDEKPHTTYTTRVTITYQNGSTEQQQVETPTGGTDHPLSNAAIVSKFLALTSRAIEKERSAQILDVVLGIDRQKHMTELLDLLKKPARNALA